VTLDRDLPGEGRPQRGPSKRKSGPAGYPANESAGAITQELHTPFRGAANASRQLSGKSIANQKLKRTKRQAARRLLTRVFEDSLPYQV
jgi:hypothetical protein